MMKPMYELPSESNVKKVIVTPEFVRGKEELTVIKEDQLPEIPDVI